MYRKLLLCYDGSTEGRNALREGAELALALHADVHVLAIVREHPPPVVPEGFTDSWFRSSDAQARQVLDEGIDWLRERGMAAQGNIVYGRAVDEITRAVHCLQPDLVVVAHRNRSRLARWWSDSEDATLLERLPCSILVSVVRPAASP